MHDARTILYVVGGIGNAALTKAAKKLINKPRPIDAPAHKKASSSGMPSSHASSLSYFSVALTLLLREPAAFGVVALACVAASWRVGAKYHTWSQVAAGWVFGSTVAAGWVLNAVPLLTPSVDGMLHTRYGPWPFTFGSAALGAVIVLLRDAHTSSSR
jgi:membrane-associated phospholipid phosphatase